MIIVGIGTYTLYRNIYIYNVHICTYIRFVVYIGVYMRFVLCYFMHLFTYNVSTILLCDCDVIVSISVPILPKTRNPH